uniref:Uncharacterized protein n=1 Tax=Panagrolaimus superbus TaxID=310955 RepID=A0A914Z948_9BILA
MNPSVSVIFQTYLILISFYSFMKKNKNAKMFLKFSDEISEEFKTRLETIVDEIIGAKNHGYEPPYIEFPGLRHDKFIKLHIIFYG